MENLTTAQMLKKRTDWVHAPSPPGEFDNYSDVQKFDKFLAAQ
jgi:hypothetical protein